MTLSEMQGEEGDHSAESNPQDSLQPAVTGDFIFIILIIESSVSSSALSSVLKSQDSVLNFIINFLSESSEHCSCFYQAFLRL